MSASDDRSKGEGEGEARRGWVGWLEQRLNLTELFSFLGHFGLVYTSIDTTRPLKDVLREIARQRVPAYTRGTRLLGPLAATLFGLQVVTGVLLAYYYRPTSEAAYESTRTIVRDLPGGWFFHQMHAWGAYLLLAVVILRLLRLLWEGLYRAPREVLWWTAVAMIWITLQLDFTGRLLVWDAQSYWSAVRGLEVIWALPVVGPILSFLLGGRIIDDNVLIRFYVLHLLVLPGAFAGLVYLTFATLRRVGLSGPPGGEEKQVTFRDHLYAMAMITLILFAVLVTLATLTPFRFFSPADPYLTPAGIRPPWYMLAPYGALHGFPLPQWVTGLLLLISSFAVLLLPHWVRPKSERAARVVRWAGLAVIAVWAAMSVAGAFVDRGAS